LQDKERCWKLAEDKNKHRIMEDVGNWSRINVVQDEERWKAIILKNKNVLLKV
jgi:hypothetical protein